MEGGPYRDTFQILSGNDSSVLNKEAGSADIFDSVERRIAIAVGDIYITTWTI